MKSPSFIQCQEENNNSSGKVGLLIISIVIVIIIMVAAASAAVAVEAMSSSSAAQKTTTTNTKTTQQQYMRAAQVANYGPIDEMITVSDRVPIPTIGEATKEALPSSSSVGSLHPLIRKVHEKDRKTHMIVRTLAVSLSPGDCRTLSGKTRRFQGPSDGKFPYVPGGDYCGVVVDPGRSEEDEDEEYDNNANDEQQQSSYFKVGDVVAGRFTVAPKNALAEYAVVSRSVCEKVRLMDKNNNHNDEEPSSSSSSGLLTTPEDAATLASASPAVTLFENHFLNYHHHRPKKSSSSSQVVERVLILGAGGGVGSHLCQLFKNWKKKKPSNNNEEKNGEDDDVSKHYYYVCGVSSDPERLLDKPILCDDAIDYTKLKNGDNLFDTDDSFLEKYRNEEQPFDTVIDLASSGGWLQLVDAAAKKKKGRSSMIVKPASEGGRYITITTDTPWFDGNTLWSMLKLFLLKPLWRWCYTRFSPFHRTKLPAFTQAMALDDNRDVLTKTFQLAYDGLLKPVRHHHDNGGVAAATTNNGFYYPMTTDGVREAFRVQQSRHAKGKVVVRVSTT